MLSSIAHLVPINGENQWSNLFAVLIEKDSSSFTKLLGLEDGGPLRVVREESTPKRHRTDLRVYDGTILKAVLEVKVLSGLTTKQLQQYEDALPGAEKYCVIHLSQFEVDLSDSPSWSSSTWEQALTAFSSSPNRWVAETAAEWLEYTVQSLPKVDALTIWNDLLPGVSYKAALRARTSWIFGKLHPPSDIKKVNAQSSAGTSWIVKICKDTIYPDYQIVIEIEEANTPRSWNHVDDSTPPSLKGPLVKVCLVQSNVDTSAGFDWDYLLKLWKIMEPARSDWSKRSASLHSDHDRKAWERMVSKGGPRSLGIGFGDRQTKISRQCMFGAKFQLPATSTLGDVVSTLESMYPLLQRLASENREQ